MWSKETRGFGAVVEFRDVGSDVNYCLLLWAEFWEPRQQKRKGCVVSMWTERYNKERSFVFHRLGKFLQKSPLPAMTSCSTRGLRPLGIQAPDKPWLIAQANGAWNVLQLDINNKLFEYTARCGPAGYVVTSDLIRDCWNIGRSDLYNNNGRGHGRNLERTSSPSLISKPGHV